jgi:hypothetical protein
MYVVCDANGQPLDARFDIQGADVILHSRGGAKGKDAVNADYSKGLLLLLNRLAAADVALIGAWVDSKTVQSVPLQDRAILNQNEGTASPDEDRGIALKPNEGDSSRPNFDGQGWERDEANSTFDYLSGRHGRSRITARRPRRGRRFS